MRRFDCDLHIHTLLSPCGDWDMTPRRVVEAALDAGLDMIAVCDHNSAENAGAVIRAGAARGLAVLPGMEICSREEAHFLGLFPDGASARRMQGFVWRHLPGDNNPQAFGYQVVANEHDEVEYECERLLVGATTLSAARVVRSIHANGGLAAASHVDRPSFSLVGQLGFIPPDLPLDAVEVSFRATCEQVARVVHGMAGLPCLRNSDAHFPGEVGRARTFLVAEEPTFAELAMALAGRNGRRIEV
ncbi:MAG: PHP-associated domain-containing protein [Desulfatibacillaceae bacterium]